MIGSQTRTLGGDTVTRIPSKNPAMYWFIVCRPDCQLNAVRHAFFRLEREAAETRFWNFHGVKRAVEELQAAWNIYYANW